MPEQVVSPSTTSFASITSPIHPRDSSKSRFSLPYRTSGVVVSLNFSAPVTFSPSIATGNLGELLLRGPDLHVDLGDEIGPDKVLA